MIMNRAVLFLFGATIASAQFVHELSAPYEVAMLPSGCPPAAELAPLICKLMQHNIKLQYKPQLMAPSTYIPPLVVEKCDNPQLHIEIELPMPVEEKKPMLIPDPPALPPITLPTFPVPVMTEEPILPPVPAVEPCEPAFVAEMPVVSIPLASEMPIQDLPAIMELPEVKEPELKPMVIPQPPELPAFIMPELLVRVAEPPMIMEPCPEDRPMQVPSMPEYIQPLAAIPAAPELPLQELSAIPQIVELPEVDIKPMAVPQPPELPAFVMPELPIRVAETSMSVAPCPEGELMPVVPFPEYIKPLAPIPAAPELPPASVPELPVRVEIPAQPMIIERPIEEPCITGELMVPETKPVFIPEVPKVPQFLMPELVEIRKPTLMPIFSAYPEAAIIADPCEPSSQKTVKTAELAPYFVGDAPYVAINMEKVVNGFRLMKDVDLLSLPYMRHV